MREYVRCSVAEVMKWEMRCLLKLCETIEENNLSYRELLSIQLAAGKISDTEYDFCLFGQKLGNLILQDEIKEKQYLTAYRNYLAVSLEVSRLFFQIKINEKVKRRNLENSVEMMSIA